MRDDLRKAFKSLCAEEGISMSRKLIQMVEAYLRKKGKLD